jgi:hypothetical protein
VSDSTGIVVGIGSGFDRETRVTVIPVARECRDAARSSRLYHATWLLGNLYKDGKKYMVVKRPGIRFTLLLCAPSAKEDRIVDLHDRVK